MSRNKSPAALRFHQADADEDAKLLRFLRAHGADAIEFKYENDEDDREPKTVTVTWYDDPRWPVDISDYGHYTGWFVEPSESFVTTAKAIATARARQHAMGR